MGRTSLKPDLKGAKIGEKKSKKVYDKFLFFILKQIKLKHVNPWVTKAPDLIFLWRLKCTGK